jgi:hypothetical protein
MSSTESSGAPAEATATNPAPEAAFPSFGTTRGSGLARGKRPSTGPAATSASAPSSDYKPTAIEVVHAPREYTNPFAPAETPAAEAAPAAPVITPPAPVAAVVAPARVEPAAVAPAPAPEVPAELNILPPAEQKTAPAQTWESEGFRPARSERSDRSERSERPRREERSEAPAADEPVDIASIPEKFLYVRPGVTFVPTPRNWGGAPRERRSADEGAPRSAESPRASAAPVAAASPEKSGGFLGWLKGLFGGSPASAEPVTAGTSASEQRREGGEHRRHRGGRNRGGPGGGGQRSGRGGRGRSGGGYRGERSEGSSQGGI